MCSALVVLAGLSIYSVVHAQDLQMVDDAMRQIEEGEQYYQQRR
jgi:hypothetical protein